MQRDPRTMTLARPPRVRKDVRLGTAQSDPTAVSPGRRSYRRPASTSPRIHIDNILAAMGEHLAISGADDRQRHNRAQRKSKS
jgi:hypothetical protein